METPRLRGVLHLITAPIAIVGGLVLVALAGTVSGRISLAVFTVTSALLFSGSAVYHIGNWSPRTKQMLRRLDHSNIFLIIAGTYTPLSIMILNDDDARRLLAFVWAGALLGVGIHNFWASAPRGIYVPIYIALGWAAVAYLPQFAAASIVVLGLLIAGGVLYTLGALVYAFKWPSLSPTWFGFHELFHAFTVLAFAAHFTAISVTLAQVR